jgi:hypothetical protein
MNKKQALTILIKNSFFLPPKTKISLLKKVLKMTDQDVQNLGSFLAYEQEFIEENKVVILKNLVNLLK